MNRKALISLFLGAAMLGASLQAGAIPDGWKIDLARNAPKYRSYVGQFKEAVLYSSTAEEPAYVFFGQFTRRTGEIYDENVVAEYYFAPVIPCYRKDLVRTDSDGRMVIQCDWPAGAGGDGGEDGARHYIGIYKNIEYSGYIVIADGATYEEVAALGWDPNPARKPGKKKH